MESGFGLPGTCSKAMRTKSISGGVPFLRQDKHASPEALSVKVQPAPVRHTSGARCEGNASGAALGAARFAELPLGVRESGAAGRGEYDARRLRSQREVIRDVMLSATDCDTWLTLGELRAVTRYGEASISAQLRHLRKTENGGYEVVKRHREGVAPAHAGTDGRGEFLWEYRVSRVACAEEISRSGAGHEHAVSPEN
jgi:hypothetical protein